MKVAGLGDLDISKDIIKNPDDYVSINGTFYKKDDKRIIKTSNGWKLFVEDDYIFDDATGNKEEKRSVFRLEYLDSDGKIAVLNTSNLAISISKEKNLKLIFHDFKNIVNDLNNGKRKPKDMDHFSPYNRKFGGVKSSFLSSILYSTHERKDKQSVVIRIDQAKELGYVLLKSNQNQIFHKSKVSISDNRPISGNYVRTNVKKLFKDRYSLNSISKDDLTFGVEIETNAGCVDPALFKLRNVDLSCTRDGSIQGGEYVTGILNKDTGFYDLYNILDVVSDRCTTDASCGIHVHIGNVMFNKDFVNLSYILGYKIQKELFTLLHPTRSNNRMCGLFDIEHYNIGMKAYGKMKHKTASDFFFSYLYEKMLYDRQFVSQLMNKKRSHPGGRYTGRYQNPFGGNITKEQFRYKWLNLITCNFNQRNEPLNENKGEYPFNYLTLEFRPYHATLDYQEIEDWILFCKAFVKYIFNESINIVKKDTVTIRDIITASYDENLYLRMVNRRPTIGTKNSFPSKLTFSQFLNHRKKSNKIYVPHNTQNSRVQVRS